ncbi:hypothetical protein GCM10009837_72440 [Streptomyces durmitorensis]
MASDADIWPAFLATPRPRLETSRKWPSTLSPAGVGGTSQNTRSAPAHASFSRRPRVAALATSHPLAARGALALADLGLRPGDLHQYLDEIRSESRDLVYRPVPDAPPAILAIAWPQQSRSKSTAALVRAAASVAEEAADGQAGS